MFDLKKYYLMEATQTYEVIDKIGWNKLFQLSVA
jgi:hypothetical protein